MAKSDKTIILELTLEKTALEGEVQKLSISLEKAKKSGDNFSSSLNALSKKEQQLLSTTKRLEKAQKSLGTASTQASKKMKQGSDATGSATAATMELSRVVSDAPFGIRGMANNITQLVSQLGSASKKAGGLGSALKLMGKQLMGPLGIVFLITAAVSALDFFYGANKKAEKSVDSLNEVFGEESTKLMVLKSVLDDSNVSLEAKQKLVKLANGEFEDLNITLDDTGTITEETSDKIDLLSLSFIKNAKARAIATLIQEEMVKQAKIESAAVGDNLKWYEQAYVALSVNIAGFSNTLTGAVKRDTDNQKESLKESSKAVKKYIDLLKEGDAELALKLFGPKKPRGGPKAKPFEAKRVMAGIFESIGPKGKENILDVPIEVNFELTDEQKRILQLELERISKDIVLDSQLEDFQEYAELIKKSVSAVSDFISGEYERELTIEKNKTNALNEELNNRLLNEQLSADQRKDIQNQIASNDEALRKKQDSINRKKFNAEKAANIAMTLMNTATAAVSVMKDAKGGFFARLAQALPTIAFGLAQVATIARTKYQSAAPSTPQRTSGGGSGSGGSGTGDRSFNFNLVGASQQNQLLNAIQSKFETPLKAFVVSKDITSQQELDVNIKGTAGF